MARNEGVPRKANDAAMRAYEKELLSERRAMIQRARAGGRAAALLAPALKSRGLRERLAEQSKAFEKAAKERPPRSKA
jgi:hypothetical protein